MQHQLLFELVRRANFCTPTPTLVDPGIVDQESLIDKSVDGQVMRGSKQLVLLVVGIVALQQNSTVTSDSTC